MDFGLKAQQWNQSLLLKSGEDKSAMWLVLKPTLMISQSQILKARGKDMGYVIKFQLTHIIRSEADSPKLRAKKLTTLSWRGWIGWGKVIIPLKHVV